MTSVMILMIFPSYARCFSYYDDFEYRHKFDSYLKAMKWNIWETHLKKIYGRYPDLIGKYQEVSERYGSWFVLWLV